MALNEKMTDIDSFMAHLDDLQKEITALLNKLYQLQKSGIDRSLWNQDYTQRKYDEDIIALVLKCISEIGETQLQVTANRDLLIKKQKTKQPFSYPSHLQDNHLNCLQFLLRQAKDQDFRIYDNIKRCLIGYDLVAELEIIFKELRKCGNIKVSESDARTAADKWAYPGTKQWKMMYNKVMGKKQDPMNRVWSRIYSTISRALENAKCERTKHQHEYKDMLLSKVSVDIMPYIEKINFALASYRKCITELKNILECETKKETDSLYALNAPWKTVLSLQELTKLTKPILTENDYKLILNWSQPHGTSTYKGKAMTSAREAEVAALKLYCDLYGNAEDVSILQITSPNDNRWKYADIATNGRWIDVKNARTSFLSKTSYSEHCVPQFKSDRNKHDVSISSFLSPYRDDRSQPIIWLGETTLGEIEKLQNEFDCQYLRVTFINHLNNSFLPAWLFDYPSVCYIDREAALAVIRSPEFIFPRQECNIGIAVLANQVISSKTEETLGLEAMELERRIKKCGLNRAVLFLHVLDRFCHTSLDNKTFKETGLDIILFSRFDRKKTPLGVYDPLETVWNLWDVLVAISEKCLNETRCFTMFRLRGANILQGRTHDGRWLTVFAYCGGWLRLENGTSVRCGQNPIYLGRDYPCQSCGHLICHRCGFCSTQCSDCKIRQDNWSSKVKD